MDEWMNGWVDEWDPKRGRRGRSLRSRRREEADAAGVRERPPPHVGGYGRLWVHTLAPRQFNLRRKVSKNELPARCSRRMLWRLRRTVISSPAARVVGGWPSALRMVSTRWESAFTMMVELRLTTTERFESVCAQIRSEEHTSELQSQSNLVCRLLLEKKKKQIIYKI